MISWDQAWNCCPNPSNDAQALRGVAELLAMRVQGPFYNETAFADLTGDLSLVFNLIDTAALVSVGEHVFTF
jgi:hypothetical protein